MVTRLFVVVGVFVLNACTSEQQMPKPFDPSTLPDAGSKGALLLVDYCSDCHGTPLPAQHPGKEWSNVVYRMNMHRLKRALGEIPEADKEVLIQYLQNHASDS